MARRQHVPPPPCCSPGSTRGWPRCSTWTGRCGEAELLQAIARVNRTSTSKDYGLVVDYYGIVHHLTEALAAYANPDGPSETCRQGLIVDVPGSFGGFCSVAPSKTRDEYPEDKHDAGHRRPETEPVGHRVRPCLLISQNPLMYCVCLSRVEKSSLFRTVGSPSNPWVLCRYQYRLGRLLRMCRAWLHPPAIRSS